jgi:hypothetical protein
MYLKNPLYYIRYEQMFLIALQLDFVLIDFLSYQFVKDLDFG